MFGKVKHKFNAIRCESDGIKFPSKLEREVYLRLKRLQTEGKILFFLRQIPFDLPGKVRAYIDFMVCLPDEIIFLEAKGKDLLEGRNKRAQVEDLFKVSIKVIFKASDLDLTLFPK